jgi:beta-mannanase
LIPAAGAYLGAWVNPTPPRTKPSKAERKSGQVPSGNQEVAQLPAFSSLIGTHVQVLHVYSEFDVPLPTRTLNAIESYGATPLLDWSCGNVQDIAAGRDDTLIRKYADELRTFRKPVFLRWYWEMNLDDKAHQRCGTGSSDPGSYVTAWRHIWSIFQAEHASNVSFVWAPSGLASKTPATAFYPGDQYVDWIGVDHYDDHGAPSTGAGAVTSLFGAFYQQWAAHHKPMMIAETGAQPASQAGYLQGLEQALPSRYPDFKALIYFDSPGKKGPYNLQGTGTTAFTALAKDPYFSYARH